MFFDENFVAGHVHNGPMRRIALLSAHASPLAAPDGIDGGTQHLFVANLARELGLAGHKVDVFTRRNAPAQAPVMQWRPNVRVLHVPAGPPHDIATEQALPYMDTFGRHVARIARRESAMYDLAHASFFLSGVVAQHVKQALGLPFVMTFHALGRVQHMTPGEVHVFPAARLRIEHSLMRDADRITAACADERQDMQRLFGTDRDRIDVAPYGFDPQAWWPVPQRLARQKLGLPLAKFIVLQLGRSVPREGIGDAIESVALLRQRHRIDAMLLVAGGEEGNGGHGATQELARRLGVAGQVQFAGSKERADLRYYYGAADAVVSTPWHEPFGITPVEAMACARPVVGAAVGAIKNAVIDGITGLLVPPRDPAAVAAALAALHADPQLARSMGDEGMRRAFQHFTWRAVARQVAAIYESALIPAALPTAVLRQRSTP